MKERGILFSPPMVEGIIADRKTKTRRLVKGDTAKWSAIEQSDRYPGEWVGWRDGELMASIFCPYGVPGDRLWLRERWQTDVEDAGTTPRDIEQGRPIFYIGGSSKNAGTMAVCAGGWRPGIHMPRWASRLTLEVVDVRVERLGDVDDAEAIAEGVTRMPDHRTELWGVPGLPEICRPTPRLAFTSLWKSIHDQRFPWDAWVWVVTFRKVQP